MLKFHGIPWNHRCCSNIKDIGLREILRYIDIMFIHIDIVAWQFTHIYYISLFSLVSNSWLTKKTTNINKEHGCAIYNIKQPTDMWMIAAIKSQLLQWPRNIKYISRMLFGLNLDIVGYTSWLKHVGLTGGLIPRNQWIDHIHSPTCVRLANSNDAISGILIRTHFIDGSVQDCCNSIVLVLIPVSHK